MDWHQLWTIVSLPDNVPIVGMMFILPFFTWYGFRQAFANDRLIDQLEADADLAKTHHRKVEPFQKGWARELHVWPYLLRMEFLAAVIVTAILMVWSITLDAPLEEPANPSLTMNPSKAPWYFLGLQELLHRGTPVEFPEGAGGGRGNHGKVEGVVPVGGIRGRRLHLQGDLALERIAPAQPEERAEPVEEAAGAGADR